MDDIPPVRPIEVVPQSAYVTRQSWALWEGLMALVSGLGESHVIYLGGVIMLSHQKPVPVNLHIFSMFLLAMSFHRDRRHLHSAVWALYFSPRSLDMGCYLPYTALYECLLQHP